MFGIDRKYDTTWNVMKDFEATHVGYLTVVNIDRQPWMYTMDNILAWMEYLMHMHMHKITCFCLLANKEIVILSVIYFIL